ncbi:MAG: carboxypeptidase M32 [Alphaproteobacteria bacterium]|nr:carboxypeptidase M32 [Alphaproteobacteria bacterium]NCQ88959.1 carboxypeptidase M32 [Alphaproteobacteria bacterium]NCT07860.1 carboxypeptidase M32 [Alphaproteobacteria bacterium]
MSFHFPFLIPSFKSLFSFFKKEKWIKTIKKILPFKIRRKKILELPSPSQNFDEEEVSKQYQNHACPNYMDLKMRFRDIGRMNAIIETLGRDFLTAMPEGAYKSRLGQIAFLSRRLHEDIANQELATLIEKANIHIEKCPEEWDEWDTANLYEMEIMYRHHCKVDPALMEKRGRLSYEGRRRHRDVLKNNDWESAKGFLQEMIDLQREIAESKCLIDNEHPTEAPYQALMREYIPGARLDDVDNLFKDLDGKLRKLLPQAIEKQSNDNTPIPLEGLYTGQKQLWLNKELLKVIGFDFDRGGLYETGHNPVEGGTPDDTRLVIKTSNRENFLESMKSALHEGGHGLYIQGLPRTQWRYQPVGQDLGAAVQESQALLVEMILGRMKPFFQYISPRVEGLFQSFGQLALTADNLHALKTRVCPTVDRKHADEISYFFHIDLRMQLERQLISGSLKVKDLPEAWNEGLFKRLGVRPTSYANGCLQDVHWFVGKFGYFPSYTLGHAMGAQFYMQMKKEIQNIPGLMREGDFKPITKWLNTNIHSKGRLMRMDELMIDVTGAALNANALINHLENRYLSAA